MILGEVRGGFFQEFVLHPQLARFAFQLSQPFPLTDTQGRLIPGVLPAISRESGGPGDLTPGLPQNPA